MIYPDALPHDMPKQISENVYVVYGCFKTSPFVRFTRNMVIIRHNNALTLINTVRMSNAGLKQLESLGKVKHVLRLGPMHGMDDAFYVDRYRAQFWTFNNHTTYNIPKVDNLLFEGSELPFPDATLFAFANVKETEGVILLKRAKHLLITADAIQSYATSPHKPHTNFFTRLMMPFIGFPNKTLIGAKWLQLMVKGDADMKPEFERLLALDFEQLIAAHGTFLKSGAHQQVEKAVKNAFKNN